MLTIMHEWCFRKTRLKGKGLPRILRINKISQKLSVNRSINPKNKLFDKLAVVSFNFSHLNPSGSETKAVLKKEWSHVLKKGAKMLQTILTQKVFFWKC